MRIHRFWFCLAGLALLATGCASSGKPAKYFTNFDQVRPGMSKSQVSKLLGLPALISTYSDAQTHVAVPDANDAWSAVRTDFENIFSDGELWQYGKYNLGDYSESPELLQGSPKSFAVWFDAGGHVIRTRQPLEGPYANPNQQRSPSASDLWKGDAFGRDKANIGPTTQP